VLFVLFTFLGYLFLLPLNLSFEAGQKYLGSYSTRAILHELQHLNLAVAIRTIPGQIKQSKAKQNRAKMSSSIPIPATRNPNKQSAHSHRTSSSTSSASSYYPYHNSASTPGSSYASSHHQYSPSSFVSDSPGGASKSGKGKGKEREADVDVVVRAQPRRASLLGM